MINRGIKYKKIKKYATDTKSSKYNKNDRVFIINGEHKDNIGTIKEIDINGYLLLIELDDINDYHYNTGDLNLTSWIPFDWIQLISDRRDDIIRNILDDYESKD